MIKLKSQNLTKIFGPHPETVLNLLEEGYNKDQIFEKTGHTLALTDISFELYEGEILVIMGLSGSGKSTLIRCVNRLIEPTAGHIFIGDDDITGLDRHALLELRRHKFGMVFQNFALFPHRNVLQNVEYGLEVQDVEPEVRREKAQQVLDLVGLGGWESAMPGQLSGGMQQRVGLARALAVEPDILLMDEAFSALDPLIRTGMQDELLALQQRVHKTVLFITHDLDEALKLGSRIILMRDGQIVQIGTPEDILTRPADDYVAQFIAGVDRSKILSAKTAMQPCRVVGYANDTPSAALDKMQAAGLSSLVVVRGDDTLFGVLTAEAARKAVQNQTQTVEPHTDTSVPAVTPDTPLTVLIDKLAALSVPLPVTDESRKLLGVVVKGAVLSVLAEKHRLHAS
jgi:glycine betaine/proline transport system ATP-binding protein